MDEATLAGIEEGYRARRFCGVCLGASPSWDGHDVDPACWGHVVESIPALVAEVRRLSAALAEQQRETECARTALNEAFVEAEAEHADATARAHAAEAALADHRAKVEAVEALCDIGAELCQYADCEDEDGDVIHVSEVRAALAAAPSGEQRKEGQR